uniref:Uncharacterized protein n=1 Tax=Micrurus spixii TaxID=129469 RepID=A0A2D4MRJ3_9SAUR
MPHTGWDNRGTILSCSLYPSLIPHPGSLFFGIRLPYFYGLGQTNQPQAPQAMHFHSALMLEEWLSQGLKSTRRCDLFPQNPMEGRTKFVPVCDLCNSAN